ncbi:hypothetical protein PROFUN_08463 [Planoprotostelium fungivorum]|uniref:Uncharacterized protein n=1 Tax=Planoprotostelium fungivorum TaxID=1890364 RepID=A0A2P6N1V2_9EUKA|nr:hypothetical protein PROFUN_08463 [Planoprotostelium fungivorum]
MFSLGARGFSTGLLFSPKLSKNITSVFLESQHRLSKPPETAQKMVPIPSNRSIPRHSSTPEINSDQTLWFRSTTHSFHGSPSRHPDHSRGVSRELSATIQYAEALLKPNHAKRLSHWLTSSANATQREIVRNVLRCITGDVNPTSYQDMFANTSPIKRETRLNDRRPSSAPTALYRRNQGTEEKERNQPTTTYSASVGAISPQMEKMNRENLSCTLRSTRESAEFMRNSHIPLGPRGRDPFVTEYTTTYVQMVDLYKNGNKIEPVNLRLG